MRLIQVIHLIFLFEDHTVPLIWRQSKRNINGLVSNEKGDQGALFQIKSWLQFGHAAQPASFFEWVQKWSSFPRKKHHAAIIQYITYVFSNTFQGVFPLPTHKSWCFWQAYFPSKKSSLKLSNTVTSILQLLSAFEESLLQQCNMLVYLASSLQ